LLDKKAEEKDKAFDVMQSILENGPWSDNLNVNELFNKLIDPFKNNRSNIMPAKGSDLMALKQTVSLVYVSRNKWLTLKHKQFKRLLQ
jgi:hypothetical protein